MFLKGSHRTYPNWKNTFERKGATVDNYSVTTNVNSTALGKLSGVIT